MPDDRVTATKPLRPPQDNVPQSKQAREALLEVIRAYVGRERLVPPLGIEELRGHTAAVLEEAGMESKYGDFAAVLLNNEAWRETVAAIPYEKRLLLLPKCLRDAKGCPASFDDIGLLCQNCGRCVIGDLKSQAEQLGYAVLVAEGSPVVMSLIEAGRIEAVIGASCLSVLERVFPYMEAGAVPGIAIPLLHDGCANTSVDLEWLWEAIYQTTEDQTQRFNLDALHRQVNEWFSREAIAQAIAPRASRTEQVALDWMAKAGKRWRPFLAVCAYSALSGDHSLMREADLRKVAIAVECFHKASLIHDDIEDGDAERYGERTLHAEHGVPIALNVGDLLLGEGYRLLAEVDVPDAQKVRLLRAAAQGHRSLCLGQGSELAWMRAPRPLPVAEVLDIFRMKTAPAFEVALSLGAILANCDEQVHAALARYSESLGIAYQIRDDLDDLRSPAREDLFNGKRPSILPALAQENPRAEVESAAWRLMETYKSLAIGSLISLKNANLKGLLRRVIARMFNDFEIMGCCDDPGARHAAGHE
ncbi:MAG TPA: polyprenyl synthetase family protein [Sedimentisphaerales bacterium]|nr:polyprenyl synthetase family protein [Sedimentisphaerales bacterium]